MIRPSPTTLPECQMPNRGTPCPLSLMASRQKYPPCPDPTTPSSPRNCGHPAACSCGGDLLPPCVPYAPALAAATAAAARACSCACCCCC